jgi:hypothetical protein
MITCNFFIFSPPFPRQVEKARQHWSAKQEGNKGNEKKAHVERLSKPTTRIMVKERTASGRRVGVRCAGGERAGLWCELLEHEGFKHGAEAQKRRKRDIHYLR